MLGYATKSNIATDYHTEDTSETDCYWNLLAAVVERAVYDYLDLKAGRPTMGGCAYPLSDTYRAIEMRDLMAFFLGRRAPWSCGWILEHLPADRAGALRKVISHLLRDTRV